MYKKVYHLISVILLLGLIFGGFSNVQALSTMGIVLQSYFVDKDNAGGNGCNDTWPGTFKQPFCTINQGIIVLQPGETLYVRGGSYPTFEVNKSNIIISGYNNEMPHVSAGEGIKIRRASYVTIKGFDVTGATGNWNAAILSIYGDHNTIEGNKVHDNTYATMSGIGVFEGSFNKVIGNEVFNNNFVGIRIFGSPTNILTGNEIGLNKVYNNTLSGGNSDGIDIDGVNVTGSFIHDNVVFGNADDGIDTWNSAHNIISGNIVYNQNGIGDGNGIKTGGGPNGGANLIKQNISYNNKARGFTSNLSGGNTYYNNVAYNNTYGFEDAMKDPSSTAPSTFINNIGYNNTKANFSADNYTAISHNNIWYSADGTPKVMLNYVTYASLSAFFLASGLDNPGGNLPSLQVNPQFTNPAAGLFDLLSSSPAIDRGDLANPGQVIAVGRVDIGAIEYSPPTAVSIVCATLFPVNLINVDFIVTFSEVVVGVDTKDFILTTNGVSGATVSGVSGSGSVYTVTVNTGSGNGTVRLDVPVSATISDVAGNPLGNLPFTGGEAYAINKNIETYIGDALTGSYSLGSSQSTRDSYVGVNNGPVKIIDTSAVSIISAERVIYNANGENTSFSEMMGLPNSQLSTTYWLPWYNNVDLDTQLRFGNVSGSTATVHVFIGGVEMVGSPFSLLTGGSTRVSFAGVNDGPVKVISDVNIVAAERVIYKVNGTNTSFTEMMALPDSQLSTTYWLPWYNNVDLDTQLRFGNVSGSTATVHVFIGGAEMTGSPFTLVTGQSTRISFAGVNNGPVKVLSDVNIVAAERVIYKVNGVNTSFSEMMALPNSQLNTTYWLPLYNNVDLDTQLRFGNVSGSTAMVHVFIGGAEMTGSPFTLLTGQSTRVSFAGVNNGSVKVISDVNIVAAERVIYKVNGTNTSFTEMMALPNSQLNTTYWLPLYNNFDLDTQLRFGVP